MSGKIDNNRRGYKNVLGYTETYVPSANTYGGILPRKQFKDSTTGNDTSGEGAATGGGTGGGAGNSPVTTYAQTLKDLEAMRQRATQGAEAQYQRAQASYGSQGASLAGAGLANSGYAAALDSAAYASMARSKDAAQTAYGQGVAAADYNRQASYADTLAKLMSGEYTGSQAKVMGQQYGYTNAQMQGISDEVRTQIASQMKADPSTYTLAYYDELAANGTISPEEAAQYQADQNLSVYNQIDRIVKSGNIENINDAAADLDTLYKNGNIDEATYNNTKRLFSSPSALTAKFNSGAITANEYIDGMVSDGAATVKADFVTSGTGISGLQISKDGNTLLHDDIDITLPSGEKFDLRTKSNSTVARKDLVLNNALNNLYNGRPSHNQIAVYNGKLYAYSDRSTSRGWYELEGDVDELDKAIAAILKYQQSKS